MKGHFAFIVGNLIDWKTWSNCVGWHMTKFGLRFFLALNFETIVVWPCTLRMPWRNIQLSITVLLHIFTEKNTNFYYESLPILSVIYYNYLKSFNWSAKFGFFLWTLKKFLLIFASFINLSSLTEQERFWRQLFKTAPTNFKVSVKRFIQSLFLPARDPDGDPDTLLHPKYHWLGFLTYTVTCVVWWSVSRFLYAKSRFSSTLKAPDSLRVAS